MSRMGGLVAVGAALLVATSAPKQLEQQVTVLADAVRDAQAEMERHRAGLIAQREQVEAVLDAVEDTLERTERKRRSAAAAASRANAPSEPVDERARLVQLARERGYEVA